MYVVLCKAIKYVYNMAKWFESNKIGDMSYIRKLCSYIYSMYIYTWYIELCMHNTVTGTNISQIPNTDIICSFIFHEPVIVIL